MKANRSKAPARAAHRPGDVLAVVEAAYAVDTPFTEWAQGLLKATNDVLVEGMYGFVCTWQRSDSGVKFEPSSTVSLGAPKELLAMVLDGLTNSPPPWLPSYLRYEAGPTRCDLTSEVDRAHDLAFRAELAAQGIPDGVNVTGADLNDFGFLISFAVAHGYELPPATRRSLRRAATHILAGLRLRKRLGLDSPGADPQAAPTGAPRPSERPEPEAVLSADGDVLHAEGDAKPAAARRTLQAAARDIERARARKWDQPKALEKWKGLVGARWSIVDRFEEGGRRYILARENQPRVGGMSTLTPMECSVVAHIARGCSTKETAYSLGITDTTVRVLLWRAARRCEVKTRRELLGLWNATH